MRRFLTVAALFVLVSEPAWAQGFFQYGSPYRGQYYRLPPYPYFTTPPRVPRRASPKPANIKIPQPEKATIGEQYAKGSIVIVNHERNLYFVEEPGQAIRYPVAIGSPVDQWEGVQTITASHALQDGSNGTNASRPPRPIDRSDSVVASKCLGGH
jgi:lipoprotein-anchoring transpeptidase ErfK/SrfK